MNRPTLQFVVLFLLFSITGIAQTFKPFSIRKNIELKGNMVVVGNSILGQDNLPFNDLSQDNQDISMQYIDIDGISGTFSSSSADVVIPNQPDGSATTCYRVAYAGLYWSAILQNGDRSTINQIKFKTPLENLYNDVVGEIVYDAIIDPIPSFSGEPANTPYACYADVTNLLTDLSSLEGTYTVANVTSSEGSNFSTGLAAGWTLLVIYENPNLETKSFTTFDGFSHIYDSHTEDIPISGFNTPPSGSIDIQMAYAALDGDRSKRATKLEIDGKEVTSSSRPANKFFGSVIENSDGVSHPRNPFSSNTLGYDTGFLEIKNAEPEYIKNGDTTSGFTLQVARGQADPVFTFLNSFAVDVIAPDIVLTKIVTDDTGTEIDGADVVLGQRLFYEITYQSVGNDNAVDFTLKDVLPDNIFFDPDTDIDLSNAGGATLQSYDSLTRTLIFNIPNGSVVVGDPKFVIRLATQVVSDCYDLSQACSNEITNQAFASYSGIINNALVVDEGSFATTECFGVPGTTNFLVDITNCNYQRDQVLCGASVDLIAADGYDSYSWSSSPTGTPVLGTGQTFTAVNTGTYYVKNTTLSTCTSINEEITVMPYGNTLINPIIPFADEVNICPNDGKSLPDIYLCGVNATRAINTGIADAVSIIWEKLDESSCSAVGVDNCANENSSCVWNEIATGPNYVSDTSGQYRIVINYPGGCFSIYYFNVYANLLAPTISARDIICNTQGQVTAGGFPTDYQYSLDPIGPYQSSNVFAIISPGYYTIYSKQVGVDSNPCIFETPSIHVRQRDVSITPNVSQPLCFGDKGTISVAINDGLPQYSFSISLGATLVSSSGLTNESDHTFGNLNKGIYTLDISTDDGCVFSRDIEIIEPDNLGATSALTKALTCEDGEITIYPTGGTPPYLYYVNSATDFQDIVVIPVTAPGVFDIRVVDSNNCSTETSITVNQIAEPVFDVTETNILCYGSNTGQIEFNVTNANGYAMEYSIDNGLTYETNPTFSNLVSGDYQALIRYTLNTTQCISSTRDIMVSEPAAAVTATAGVSELAGCGPSGGGRVRITNPQGGVSPYEYSFDNQATWTSTNQEYLVPGTYTLYIKDANNCIFSMPSVTVDPEPVAPTIDISDPDFNCDGSANSTVTITNPGSNAFAYTYLIDGIENPNTADPTTFLNVPDGPHTFSVRYQLLTVPTFSELLSEDFGYGTTNVISDGVNTSTFKFEPQSTTGFTGSNNRIANGEYSVTSEIIRPYGPWLSNVADHSSATISDGRFLVVNMTNLSLATSNLYSKRINDIIPNQKIKAEMYLLNLLKVGTSIVPASNGFYNPNLTLALIDPVTGNVVSSIDTGDIPPTDVWTKTDDSFELDPGAYTTLDLVVRNNKFETRGNDVAFDDIRIYQLPTACVTQVDFPIVIGTGNAFDASIVRATDVTCFGANDGTITISAQNFDPANGFQYSLDGTNWSTQMTSPHTIPDLADGSYNVQIRYDGIATGCDFSFNQSISAPAPLSVNASASPITCNDGAVVTASASGGTAAYSYELLDTTLSLVSNFPANGILPNVGAGDYIVRVTDANNCTETTTLNLVDPTPPTAVIINEDYCYDTTTNGATFEIDASGGQAPYEYSINGSAFDTNPVFENLTPAIYIIVVRDAYGCEFTLPSETIAPQVAISTTLTKELDCTASPNAVITGTISNGYPDGSSNYEYAVSFNSGTYTDLGSTGTSFTYNDAAAPGTYQFQITDANSCQILSDIVTVSPVVLPTATTNVVNPLCNGDANGSVQIISASGVSPYEYSFDGSTFSTTSSYPGLAAGTYAFEVKDSKECVFLGSVTLTNPTVLVVSANATAFTCDAANGKQSAVVTIAIPSTGTAPYTYSFDGGTNFSSSNTLTLNDDGTDQIINYAVKDANGCTAGDSLIIDQLNPPTDLEISATDITCDNTTSTATITSTTNGVGTLQYETIAPSPIIFGKQTSNIFPGLTAGTYLFRVTDANGCYYSESINIAPVTNISVRGAVANNVTCNGGSNGTVGFRVGRFSSTYSYTFDTDPIVVGQTNVLIPKFGLSAGVYTIIVTDETTGCSDTTTVTVTEPANALTLVETTNINGNCFDLAQLTVLASGGTPTYTYAFVQDGLSPSGLYTASDSSTLDPALNTDWDVWVMDNQGCTFKLDVTIGSDPAPSIDDVALQCYTGTPISITLSGSAFGTPTYSMGGAYQLSPTFSINAPGIYDVNIKDTNGCIASKSFELKSELLLDANMTQDLTCLLDGSINLISNGGTGTLTYEVDFNSTGYAVASSPYLATVDGTYKFRVTDGQGCQAESDIVTVNPTAPVTVSTAKVDPTCNGDTDGSIILTALTGEAPFTYSIDGGTTFVSSNVFGGLTAGTYNYVVKDSKDCETPAGATITINDPAPIVPDIDTNGIACNTVTPGSFDIDILSGGTAPYTYKLYDNSFTEIGTYTSTLVATSFPHSFTGLNFGDYYITIVDAIGCEFKSTELRIEPTPYMDLTSQTATASCATGVEVVLNVTGGIPNYTYSIFGQPSTAFGPTALTTHTFTGLDQGTTYQFEVIDVNGCPSYIEVTTDIISPIEINPIVPTNVTCNGADNGEVSFTVDQYDASTTDLYYEVRDNLTNVAILPANNGHITGLTGAPANETITGLAAGSYTLYVLEFDGITLCSTAEEFQITQPIQSLASVVTSEINANCNSGAQLTLTTTGGTGPYEYAAVIAGSPAPAPATYNVNNVIIVDTSLGLNWQVYVKDANNCEIIVSETVAEDPLPTVTTTALASNQCADSSGFTFTATGASGLPPYQYSINGGASYQLSDTFIVNTAGSYTVTIKDTNGCTATSPTPTEIYEPLNTVASITKELDCTISPDAEITVTISGGNGPFSYTVQKGAGAPSVPSAPIVGPTFTYSVSLADLDSYTFVVTDANSCPSTSTIAVDPITNPGLAFTQTNVSCNLGSNGTVQLIASGGSGGYTYSDDNVTFTATSLFVGLSAGPHTFYVQDSKNCTSSTSVTITEPSELVVSANTPSFSCDVSNIKQEATVVIDIPSTGTAPYTYSFDGVNYSSSRTLTVFDNGTDQTINYFVKDANGCTESGSLIIQALNSPTDLDFNPITTVTCAVPTSNVELTATNGVGVLEYETIAPSPVIVAKQASNIITGLTEGTYVFRVTDANGCYYTESYTVTPVTNITVRGAVANDVSCNGGSDGTAGFRVGSFSSTYSYTFDTDPIVVGQTNVLIPKFGLSAGVHTITVTDEVTGCTDSFSVTVSEPTNPLSITNATATKVHCNNYNSFITVTTSGGTLNYSYAAVISGNPAPVLSDYVSNNVLSVDTNLGTDLTWDVYVDDAKGCVGLLTPTTVNIVLDEAPSVSVPTDAVCSGGTSGFEFTAINTTGPLGEGSYEFSIGNGFQSSPAFTVTTPGDYIVTIKDGNGCEADSGTITVHPALDLSPTVTTLPSCANNDGVITVTGSGGSGLANYNYTISPSVGTTPTATGFSGLAASTLYTVTITDGITNCTKDATITLGIPTPVSFTTTPTAVSCNGATDGTITVNLPVSNDNPIYTYSLDGGVTTQTSNVFSGLVAGPYMITVTSGRNCVLTQPEIVIEPAAIVIPTPAVVEYACTASTNATTFATITVNGVIGGSSNYTIYEFIKGAVVVQATDSNVFTEADLSGGVYTINVYDDNGCSETTTATIEPFIGLDTLDVTVDNAITCTNYENITISVTSTGGAPTRLNYTVEDVDGTNIGGVYSRNNTSGIFTSLPIGDYVITVLNEDTGCSLQTVHYVNEPNTFDITIDNVIDVTCFSDSNGSIDVSFIDRTPTPTDESGPFTYTIDDALGNPITSGMAVNAGPITIPGFASGTYTLTASLTGSPFCTITKNFTITAPTQALSIAETHTQITCVSGNNDGSILASATGGWTGDYEFQLELTAGSVITPYSTVSNFSGLIEGDYTVNVRDSKGCIVSTNVLLENPDPITADIAAIPAAVLCFGDSNSSIKLSNVAGGQESNYTFTLNMVSPVVSASGPQTSDTFNGLGAGTYNVLIQDGYSCEFTTADVVITQPSTIDALLVQTSYETCTSGSSMILSATGGTGPYEYSDTESFTTVIGGFATDATIIIFPATTSITYKYYVRDANGCISGISNEITIDPLPELIVDIDATNAFINCTGDTTGVIVANAQGGLGNYTYSLQDGSGTDITPAPIQSSPGIFTDLPAGTYQVHVTSGIDCDVVSTQVSITEPTFALQTSFSTTDVTCAGGEDGSIEIVATGGTGIIKYAISPQLNQFFESPIFEDLAVGTYQVVVQDELGCFVLIDFVIDEPTPVMLSIVQGSIVPEVCTGDFDGAFSVDIMGGALPYSYSIDDIAGTYTLGGLTQTQFDFDNLNGGDHIVYVRDGAGCESEWNITLPESVLLDPQVSIEYGCTSNLSTNTVTVSVDSGITNLSDVDYSLNGSAFQASNIFTDVTSGLAHTITVRHTNGCEKISPDFDIDQIEPLELLIGDGQLNQIVAEVSGGVGPYEYTVNGEDYGDEEKYFIYSSGDYTVNVTDANGCVSAVTSYFEYIDVCIPNYFTPNGDGTLDEWGPGCTTQYKDLSVRVFDRYGRQIKLLRVNEKWDGNYNGKTLPSGDYWYILKLNNVKDDREFIGHFTLYR